MINPFEQIGQSTENQKEQEVEQKDDFNSIKTAVEYKIGKKLPENKEDLFRKFDELIPAEIDHIDFKKFGYVGAKKNQDGSLDLSHAARFTYLEKISREEFKAKIEKELYGTTMDDVKKFVEAELKKIEKDLDIEQLRINLGYKKDFDPGLLKKHDKITEVFNELNFGSLEIPLADIELKIYDTHTNESEKETLRIFAERLSIERYNNKFKSEIDINDIKKHIEKQVVYFSSAKDDEFKNDNKEHLNKVLEGLDNGDLAFVSEEIEFSIGWIQERLEDRKNKDLKNLTEKILKERYGEDFKPAVNEELGKLRSYRKFLRTEETRK